MVWFSAGPLPALHGGALQQTREDQALAPPSAINHCHCLFCNSRSLGAKAAFYTRRLLQAILARLSAMPFTIASGGFTRAILANQ